MDNVIHKLKELYNKKCIRIEKSMVVMDFDNEDSKSSFFLIEKRQDANECFKQYYLLPKSLLIDYLGNEMLDYFYIRADEEEMKEKINMVYIDYDCFSQSEKVGEVDCAATLHDLVVNLNLKTQNIIDTKDFSLTF